MKASENQFPSITLEEVASDGSDLTNPAADHRRLFLGEDGALHLRDSSGTVTAVGGGIADQGAFTYLDATEAAAPATPASGKVRLYAKTDGLLYSKDDAGLETVVTGSGTAGGGWGIDADKYHPDNETPATTPALAEEMNGSFAGSWAWAPTSPGTVDFTSMPGWYLVKNDTTNRWLSCAWTPGASDVTVAMKLSGGSIGGTDGVIWFGVASATGADPADAVMMGFQTKVYPTSWPLQFYNRNSGSYSAIIAAGASGQGATNMPVYLRLTRLNSGPTWTAYLSADGHTWTSYGTTGSKSLTIGAICVRLADKSCDVAIDWIRAWSSIVEHVGA